MKLPQSTYTPSALEQRLASATSQGARELRCSVLDELERDPVSGATWGIKLSCQSENLIHEVQAQDGCTQVTIQCWRECRSYYLNFARVSAV